MRPDQEEALRLMQERSIDMALAEHEKAHGIGLDTKDDRGNRGWLTKMAGTSIGLAVKVEQFFQLRSQRQLDPDADDAETEAMVKRASADVTKLLQAINSGPQERPKRGRKAAA